VTARKWLEGEQVHPVLRGSGRPEGERAGCAPDRERTGGRSRAERAKYIGSDDGTSATSCEAAGSWTSR
jgi:hypothetical protein